MYTSGTGVESDIRRTQSRFRSLHAPPIRAKPLCLAVTYFYCSPSAEGARLGGWLNRSAERGITRCTTCKAENTNKRPSFHLKLDSVLYKVSIMIIEQNVARYTTSDVSCCLSSEPTANQTPCRQSAVDGTDSSQEGFSF